MALIQIPVADSATATAPPLQITRQGVVGTIIYTVPVGRVFVGHFYNNTSASVTAVINAINSVVMPSNATGVYTPELTLIAGTTVALNSATSYLLGVESDA